MVEHAATAVRTDRPPPRWWLIGVAAALVAIVAIVGYLASGTGASGAAKGRAPAAIPVAVVAVAQQSMPGRIAAIGNVEPFATVAVKARVDGQILDVGFKEGDEVREGKCSSGSIRGRTRRRCGRPRRRTSATQRRRPGALAGEALPRAAREELRLQGRLRAVPHQRRDRGGRCAAASRRRSRTRASTSTTARSARRSTGAPARSSSSAATSSRRTTPRRSS